MSCHVMSCLSILSHGTTRLPLDRIFECFAKICRESSRLVKNRTKKQVLYMKTQYVYLWWLRLLALPRLLLLSRRPMCYCGCYDYRCYYGLIIFWFPSLPLLVWCPLLHLFSGFHGYIGTKSTAVPLVITVTFATMGYQCSMHATVRQARHMCFAVQTFHCF